MERRDMRTIENLTASEALALCAAMPERLQARNFLGYVSRMSRDGRVEHKVDAWCGAEWAFDPHFGRFTIYAPDDLHPRALRILAAIRGKDAEAGRSGVVMGWGLPPVDESKPKDPRLEPAPLPHEWDYKPAAHFYCCKLCGRFQSERPKGDEPCPAWKKVAEATISAPLPHEMSAPAPKFVYTTAGRNFGKNAYYRNFLEGSWDAPPEPAAKPEDLPGDLGNLSDAIVEAADDLFGPQADHKAFVNALHLCAALLAECRRIAKEEAERVIYDEIWAEAIARRVARHEIGKAAIELRLYGGWGPHKDLRIVPGKEGE